MKANRFTLIASVATLLFAAQSCLMEQKDIFSESSSTRMQKYLAEVETTLKSNTDGWIMEYYPGTGQKFGGYVFHVKFEDGGNVTVGSELHPADTAKSFYKMTTDNGPVLSFDTNNDLFHVFATPSSSLYEAKGGDFEFAILNCSKEKIEMKGKRSGNVYTLLPFVQDKDTRRETYLTEVYKMAGSVKAATVEGVIGDKEVTGDVDLNNRRITLYYKPDAQGDSVTAIPFRYTPEGIRAYKPVKVGGCTFQDLFYLEKNNLLTNGVFTLQCKVPENYVPYEEFEGKYNFIYYQGSKSAKVTLTPNEDKTGFVMSGLSTHFDVNLQYDKARGRLKWYVQSVGSHGNNSIMMAAWSLDAQGGSLTWSTDAGVVISKNLKTGLFEFEDNGEYEEGFGADSFILWEITPDGTSVDQYTGWGDSQYPYLTSMQKLE